MAIFVAVQLFSGEDKCTEEQTGKEDISQVSVIDKWRGER